MDWIKHMQENYDSGKSPIAPNKWTYNAYLEALSKTRRPSIGEEAEQILEEMDAQYRIKGKHMKPDVLTFTNVIHCIALSGAKDAFERAYAILTKMENLHSSGYGDVRPNTVSLFYWVSSIVKAIFLILKVLTRRSITTTLSTNTVHIQLVRCPFFFSLNVHLLVLNSCFDYIYAA